MERALEIHRHPFMGREIHDLVYCGNLIREP